jgi:spermidine synthase
MAGADRITTWAEDRFYGDNVVLRENSDYQRIVVTSGPAGVRLFLNGNLQFHSRDEYRYHEALVHPAMAAHGAPRRCWCWVAATAWRCARCSSTRVSSRSRWSSWTRT